mmetsp:Transcript_36079/g.47433  ORF Transcript_36079/g.47433 Transcript_36079/m.47433 type:complete len:101 (+) Transcript_36079:367-669(+)|eukprot:CAMPEP_0185614032 /NCGR_PEP_ID=MMETSP0436-20130131/29910_1 /TAXON_ID=626734 ORGANISM="Favella taraikaensis, Strain Fe Narragansett Bay" /NCGR_SAMPLE_ID=MMETSP0436 /ASSEMBLY_ACC=CAM_ASM_000390 /LENGTH=100 /DNA_ID=CAMNT_0028248491 /DNA_START=324 /DNA_END=626 /DNA_ORIENTATION=+
MRENDRLHIIEERLALAPRFEVCVDQSDLFDLIETVFDMPITMECQRFVTVDPGDLPHELQDGIVGKPEVVEETPLYMLPWVAQVPFFSLLAQSMLLALP